LLKIGSEAGIPSKIIPSKGLSGVPFWAEVSVLAKPDAPRSEYPKLSKGGSLTAVIEQLMYSSMCYPNRNARSSPKTGRAGRGGE
jgi:hypothetical protein